MTTLDIIAAARACCAVKEGEYLGPQLRKLEAALAAIANDAVVVSRALLLEAVEQLDGAVMGPCDDPDETARAIGVRLRVAAG